MMVIQEKNDYIKVRLEKAKTDLAALKKTWVPIER